MKTRGVSFFEAVKELADAASIVVEERELSPQERQRLQHRADLYDVTEHSARLFTEILLTSPEGAPGRQYLANRGITLETAQKYRLGYAPESFDRLTRHLQQMRIPAALALGARVVGRREGSERVYDVFRNRLMFPILDDRARVVAFGGRILPGPPDAPKVEAPKYVNSQESEIYNKSKTLYGLSWARTAVQRKDRLMLVEGYFDAVSLWQAGVEEAVATCGTALTEAHLEVIKRLTRKVVALFDMDEAGLRAATKAMEFFIEHDVQASRLELAPAKDPDEFVQRFGAEEFEKRMQAAQPLLDLVFDRSVRKEGGSTEGRARAEAAIVPMLRRLPARVRLQMIAKAADVLGFRPNDLLERVGHVDDAPPGPPPASAPPPRWKPSKELAHLLWLLLHFPAQVAPVLAETDPELITDRRTVLEAIVALAGGAPLSEVADPERDADLARALRAIAARDAEYKEEQAESVARAQLARLELSRIEAKILTINARIAACETSGDKSSYVALAKEVFALQVRQRELMKLIVSRSPRR
jgi:DNA primase